MQRPLSLHHPLLPVGGRLLAQPGICRCARIPHQVHDVQVDLWKMRDDMAVRRELRGVDDHAAPTRGAPAGNAPRQSCNSHETDRGAELALRRVASLSLLAKLPGCTAPKDGSPGQSSSGSTSGRPRASAPSAGGGCSRGRGHR